MTNAGKSQAMESLIPLVNDLQDIFNGLGFSPIELPQICVSTSLKRSLITTRTTGPRQAHYLCSLAVRNACEVLKALSMLTSPPLTDCGRPERWQILCS